MDVAHVGRALIPRVIKLRTHEPSTAADDRQRAVEWWSQDAYVQFYSRRALRWLGVNWVSWKYNKFPGAYLAPADDLVDLLEELFSAGVLPRLTSASHVFEGGCNLGRNLLAIQDRYRCAVTGMDVSPRAIETAKRDVWAGRERWDLILDNALSTRWFDSVPDGHFDLSLSRWHLMHIPASPEKSAYVRHLMRIAKVFLLLEPSAAEKTGTVEYQYDGRFCVSWDDWGKYGLTEFTPKKSIEATRVFFAAKPTPRVVA